MAAIWVMPMVLAHVGRRDYPDVTPEGRHVVLLSVWNAVWVSVFFLFGWLITLPLWLIPPLGLVLSLFWWSFAFSRMMRVDALVDHASPLERKVLWIGLCGVEFISTGMGFFTRLFWFGFFSLWF